MTEGQKKSEICVWRCAGSNQGAKRGGKGTMKGRKGQRMKKK